MELKEFFLAVLDSWVEKVGIFLTIISVIEKIPRVKVRLEDKPIIERFVPVLWVIAAFCVFWGFYSAWLVQYRARLQAETDLKKLTIPYLAGEIRFESAASAGDKEQDSIFTLIVAIENHGAPSIAKNIIVTLKTSAGKTIGARILQPPNGPIKLLVDGQKGFEFQPSEFLLRQVGAEPIPTNGSREGFLVTLALGITKQEIFSGNTVAEITFSDIQGKPYKIEKRIGTKQPFLDIYDLQKH